MSNVQIALKALRQVPFNEMSDELLSRNWAALDEYDAANTDVRPGIARAYSAYNDEMMRRGLVD